MIFFFFFFSRLEGSPLCFSATTEIRGHRAKSLGSCGQIVFHPTLGGVYIAEISRVNFGLACCRHTGRLGHYTGSIGRVLGEHRSRLRTAVILQFISQAHAPQCQDCAKIAPIEIWIFCLSKRSTARSQVYMTAFAIEETLPCLQSLLQSLVAESGHKYFVYGVITSRLSPKRIYHHTSKRYVVGGCI